MRSRSWGWVKQGEKPTLCQVHQASERWSGPSVLLSEWTHTWSLGHTRTNTHQNVTVLFFSFCFLYYSLSHASLRWEVILGSNYWGHYFTTWSDNMNSGRPLNNVVMADQLQALEPINNIAQVKWMCGATCRTLQKTLTRSPACQTFLYLPVQCVISYDVLHGVDQ